ncbi:GNAT family N-acetyltransferase [Fusobacterium varium]|uniref:GNAT family N-acetyltransferase n=1 Tax=Fusobacterium varium TaxID=856 RepID=UPI00242A5BE5|nr:GNAT family N-acetyltransferase [Fusobacterium varium]
MTNKERYKTLCEKEKTIPLFSQYWWMNTVCKENEWDVFLIGDEKNIIAAMPYYITIRNNKKIITKAKLTQNNGVWIKYPKNQKISSRLSYEERIINQVCDFIEMLSLDKYEQQYHYNFTNWLPFFWRYYKEITRYTYVIENTVNIEEIKKNYSSKIRNQINNAKKILKVEEKKDLINFYKINKLSFERQNIEIPYSFEFFKNLFKECDKRNCCKLLFAVDSENNIHSVAMIVWDEESVYYLLNGTDPDFKQYQGNALLIDRSIEIAYELGKKFDFEGSVIKNIEQSFRQYGGIPKPYFRIYKEFKMEKENV